MACVMKRLLEDAAVGLVVWPADILVKENDGFMIQFHPGNKLN